MRSNQKPRSGRPNPQLSNLTGKVGSMNPLSSNSRPRENCDKIPGGADLIRIFSRLLRSRDVNVTGAVINHGSAAPGGIAARINLASINSRCVDAALATIQLDGIPS